MLPFATWWRTYRSPRSDTCGILRWGVIVMVALCWVVLGFGSPGLPDVFYRNHLTLLNTNIAERRTHDSLCEAAGGLKNLVISLLQIFPRGRWSHDVRHAKNEHERLSRRALQTNWLHPRDQQINDVYSSEWILYSSSSFSIIWGWGRPRKKRRSWVYSCTGGIRIETEHRYQR